MAFSFTNNFLKNPLVSPYGQGQLAYQEARGGSSPDRHTMASPSNAPAPTGPAVPGSFNPFDPRSAPTNAVKNFNSNVGLGPAPGANDPGKGSSYAGTQSQTPAAGTPARGSESGPGILESWFRQRAEGTDPGFEYASKRAADDIDRRMAAGGSFNSGARGQAISDMYANLTSQREGQLDSLAGGASGEHQGRLNSMFNVMNQLAGGQAGVTGAYDLKSADALNAANQAILSMYLNKAGVDSQSNQAGLNNLFKLGALIA